MNIRYKILLTNILLLLLSIQVSAQTSDSVYVITLKDSIHRAGHGEISSLQTVKDQSFLKGIPDINCDLSAVKYFKLNQYIRNDSLPNQIYLFIGADTIKGRKYIKVDTNQNYDFSDDELFDLPLADKSMPREEKLEKCFRIPIITDALYGGMAYVGIDPYCYLGIDSPLDVFITFGYYMMATSQIKNIPVEIYAYGCSNLLDRKLGKRNDFSVLYKNVDDSIENKGFMLGDTVQIQHELFKLTKINHPDIYLTSIGTAPVTGFIGSSIPELWAKEINEDKDISLNELMKNKYVFIDFWGSWCNPCIATIPKLKEFYEQIKNRTDVILLGLALEDKKDIEKLKKIVRDRELDWSNYWLDNKDSKLSTSTIKKLSIKTYPTYMIIDNKGKIIHRSGSMYGTNNAISLFLDIINSL